MGLLQNVSSYSIKVSQLLSIVVLLFCSILRTKSVTAFASIDLDCKIFAGSPKDGIMTDPRTDEFINQNNDVLRFGADIV